MTFDMAFVRSVPDSFAEAIVAGPRPRIDVARARRQHASYVAALRTAGLTIETVAADADHPDCPFIEDTAVVLGELAVITRPGAPSRRGEVHAVAEVIGRYLPLTWIEPPGTLDGGDVLAIGNRVFVGRSTRTNGEGIRQLEAVASRQGLTTTPVDVHCGLHLKSGAAVLDDETVMIRPEAVEADVFYDYRTVEKAGDESGDASVLRLPDGRLLVTTSAPKTAERIADLGFDVIAVDVTQFQAVDGGLTCMSILVPEVG